MGVDVVSLKILVFSFTSLLVGLTASIYFHTVPRLTPEILDLLEMGFLVVYAVVGGLESPVAGAIAAIVLVVTAGGSSRHRSRSLSLRARGLALRAFGALLVVTLRLAPDGFIAPLVARLGRVGRRPVAHARGRAGGTPGTWARSRSPAGARGAPRPRPERRAIDLRVERVTMHFGGFVALDGVTFCWIARRSAG